jgi:hypothetical protein
MENKKITTYTPSVSWGITLEEAKLHLNILDTSFDSIISDYIDSAHVMLWNEAALLIKGAVTGYLDYWYNFRVDVSPVDTIAIYYYDVDNTRTLLTTSNYNLNSGLYTFVEFKGTLPPLYDKNMPIEVEVTTTVNSNPMVKQALRMLVADLFENRQNEVYGSIKQISRGTAFQLSLISQRSEV